MYLFRIGVVTSLILIVLAGRVESAENEIENWYMYWGLGTSRTTWPAPLNDAMDIIAAHQGHYRTRLSADILGFYKPINPKSMMGYVFNVASDNTSDPVAYSIDIDLYTHAASAQYFLEEIGKGLFCRGDLGIAELVINDEIVFDPTLKGWIRNDEATSESGLGILVGVGYAHPITSGTRIVLNLNYATRRIEGDSYNTIGISLGGLF